MKKLLSITALVALVVISTGILSCKKKSDTVLSIGATPEPHAQMLEFIKEDYAKKGYTLHVVEFTDYVAPNVATLDGSIDANFFQHIPYLETREDWAKDLINAFGVHVEPFALYSAKYKDISELPNGARIGIPNDPTNCGRALLLFEANGIIRLNSGESLTATELDIAENPREFKFIPMEAAQLSSKLQDVDAACINGNYAMQAGLSPSRDALIIEGSSSPYVNIVVVKKGFENDPRVAALKEVMLSDKMREFITTKWPDGSVTAVF